MTESKKENKWEEKLRKKISQLMQRGVIEFDEILSKCDGAQPKDVFKIYEPLKNNPPRKTIQHNYKNEFFFKLPAANPRHYQWWYTLESQESMCHKIIENHPGEKILCLGTPTLAATLAANNAKVTLLDIDSDIIDLYNDVFPENEKASNYDVNCDIPEELEGKFNCIFIDPPWYQEDFKKFISRSIDFSKNGAVIYCSIPQKLTRPGIEEERVQLINEIKTCGHDLLYIEANSMKYIIPHFEEEALENLKIKTIQPWRSSDLMAIRVKKTKSKKNTLKFKISENRIRSFSRKSTRNLFRIFTESIQLDSCIPIKRIEAFSSSISNRDTIEPVNLWTSEKQGFQVSNLALLNDILDLWSQGHNIEATTKKIQNKHISNDASKHAKEIINELESLLKLWEMTSDSETRRTAKKIKEANDKSSSKWASKATKREHDSKSDSFRIEFQRDRDRIIWSTEFRKLADKTQLFPIEEDEHMRQRLAHSIEVMQLASTIGAAFGLDKNLIEAGALAHDIGHTPFGHAGEHAIDKIFVELGFAGGFNHYEHGVDVVRFLEGSYQHSATESHHGLNLTSEVCDCILKHTYCHQGEGASQEKVWKHTKHTDYLKCGFSHLEGQAVRAADKISYLLSDIEDGIRLGTVQISDLLSCKLFHRAPIDFRMKTSENLYGKFIEQRGSVIKLLMEDIITESAKRISKLNSRNDVFNAGHYCISHSKQISLDMSEIWRKIQVAKLHKDPRVLSSNMKASKMVSELLLMLTLFPEHINQQFRMEHERLNSSDYMKYYRRQHQTIGIENNLLGFLPLATMIGFDFKRTKNIDVYNLILAKDYVASLTDKKLKKLHMELLGL